LNAIGLKYTPHGLKHLFKIGLSVAVSKKPTSLLKDTLTHPLTKIAGGALPIAAETAQNATLHSLGQTLVNYGGALLASTLIHLTLTLIAKLKKSKIQDENRENNQTETIK
jgi:hypothetical protein